MMLTRRVHGGVFRLRPCKWVDQIVRYVTAVMAKKWNIELHAMVVMSNHWHVVKTDPDGNIADFERDCHHFFTCGINARFGDSESMWSSEQSSRVVCEEPGDVINKIAYTMVNPVEAGLVRFGKNWPGVRHSWPCKPMVIKRPGKYFRGVDEGGEWPEEAVLEFTRPPGYDELDDEDLAAVIAGAVGEREEKFQKKYDQDGRRFLGRRGILRQSRYDRPRTKETRSRISPRVACRDKWRRIERLAANKRWHDDYYAALARWRDGDREVEFPAGTYKMRVVHGVNCARAPD